MKQNVQVQDENNAHAFEKMPLYNIEKIIILQLITKTQSLLNTIKVHTISK